MDLYLTSNTKKFQSNIVISGSKSESNRLLILQQLYNNLIIENLSNSDDTKIIQKALSEKYEIIDVHHAGTAMRFLTAFFALKLGAEKIITGSERMKQRPIGVLVDALKQLGADIEYLENEGYPPLKIKGKKLTKNKVSVQGNISSQYISALLLIAPTLKNGLEIELLGEITSIPYIKMTLSLLSKLGVKSEFKGNIIRVNHKPIINNKTIVVESDWSSASYWYSFVALSDIGSEITLSSYKKNSLQGDNILVKVYKKFGVKTEFLDNKITLKKVRKINKSKLFCLDLKNYPDIAQTIVVTCLGLGISCELKGLHTLKIKETDRLVALKNELGKFGAKVEITEDSLLLKNPFLKNKNVSIKTYNDHRMAMAFVPLVLKTSLTILDAGVVSKSYPNFWNDIEKIGIKIS